MQPEDRHRPTAMTIKWWNGGNAMTPGKADGFAPKAPPTAPVKIRPRWKYFFNDIKLVFVNFKGPRNSRF
jgi:hypothetical protein